jgi:spore coat protein U-like protein
MKPFRQVRCRSLAPLWLLIFAASADAANCNLAVPNPFAFGAYNTINNLDIAVDFTVSCSKTTSGTENVNVVVSFSSGSGTFVTRTMSNGISTLNYNLYKDPARTQVRGDGSGATATGTASFTLTNAQPSGSASGTIYGRVFGGQDVTAGNYSTTAPITVTMTF